MRGKFVPQSTIDRRMASRDARLARELRQRMARLAKCMETVDVDAVTEPWKPFDAPKDRG